MVQGVLHPQMELDFIILGSVAVHLNTCFPLFCSSGSRISRRCWSECTLELICYCPSGSMYGCLLYRIIIRFISSQEAGMLNNHGISIVSFSQQMYGSSYEPHAKGMSDTLMKQ
jgi:hypothetical protein